MQLTNSLFAISGMLAALGSVAAAPATKEARELQTRADGHIYACTDWNYQGNCQNLGFNNGQCTNFPSGLQDNISSIGPDGGWTCQIFVNYNCFANEGSVTVAYPGISAVSFDNDKFSSFVCTWSG